jgi:hypothetical protein
VCLTAGGKHNSPLSPTLTMQALSSWPHCTTGVLTDIDDTLTRDGAIEPAALQALHRLRDAGIPVIAVTGRPSGWSEGFALDWPINAIVAENGSVRLSNHQNSLQKSHIHSAAERSHNHARLQEVLHAIERQVPGAHRAQDSAGRETDIAIDHSEFNHLDTEAIEAVVRLMRAGGLTATVSSIHINGWIGQHNKWSGAQWAVQDMLGRTLSQELDQWVYVGDSTNDQVMFQHMPVSVGVANIHRFAHQLSHRPRYVTPSERGKGFAEVASAVLGARQSNKP